MEYKEILGKFLLTKKFENFEFNTGIDFSLSNIKVSKLSTLCSLFFKLYNNYDFIIETLENSKNIIEESLFNVPDYIEKSLLSLDETLARIFSREITNYICFNNSRLSSLERDLRITEQHIAEISSNDDFINDLKDDEAELLKEIEKFSNRQQNLCTYITKLITYITNYKFYFDLYFGIGNNKKFKKKNISLFQSMFNISFYIPKHQFYQAFIEKDKIILSTDMMLSCYTELKEHKQEKILDEEIYDSIYKKTQKLIMNDKFFTLCNYEISSIKDLLCIYFIYFIENKITINKCKNCGKYFIPVNRVDEKYCDNISPQKPGKTCKEYGVKLLYTKSIASDPIKKAHQTVTTFYRVKKTRAKQKNDLALISKIDKILNKYLTDYKKQLKKYEKNALSEDKFIEWIYSQKQEV